MCKINARWGRYVFCSPYAIPMVSHTMEEGSALTKTIRGIKQFSMSWHKLGREGGIYLHIAITKAFSGNLCWFAHRTGQATQCGKPKVR